MISDYNKGGLRAPSIDTMAKSLKLSEEENFEDSWKAIPNYLRDKYGGLHFLLRCNYDKTFLARINLPQFYKKILQHFLEFKTFYNDFIKNLFIQYQRYIVGRMFYLLQKLVSDKYLIQDLVTSCRT